MNTKLNLINFLKGNKIDGVTTINLFKNFDDTDIQNCILSTQNLDIMTLKSIQHLLNPSQWDIVIKCQKMSDVLILDNFDKIDKNLLVKHQQLDVFLLDDLIDFHNIDINDVIVHQKDLPKKFIIQHIKDIDLDLLQLFQ